MFTHSIVTSISIQAPPSHVRETLLDFANLPQWSTKFVYGISIVAPAPSSASAPPESTSTTETTGSETARDPSPGSRLKVQLKGMTISPIVQVNTPEEFAWLGSLLIPKVVFDGRHSFAFKAVPGAPNETEFVHSEQFQGMLVWLMKTSFGTDTGKSFGLFNEELKKRCEETFSK